MYKLAKECILLLLCIFLLTPKRPPCTMRKMNEYLKLLVYEIKTTCVTKLHLSHFSTIRRDNASRQIKSHIISIKFPFTSHCHCIQKMRWRLKSQMHLCLGSLLALHITKIIYKKNNKTAKNQNSHK